MRRISLMNISHCASQAYFARIEEVNNKGPKLHAVIELNPSALKQAALLDLERRYSGKRSELHGIPILLKASEWIVSRSR